jgi:hypothetical protein
VNRRDFVGRVSLGAAAVCTGTAARTSASSRTSGLTVRFVGMMGFIERTDRSFLVAAPGQEAGGRFSHRPFLMARAGTRAAQALAMRPAPDVIPGAFDTSLMDRQPGEFVYRCLENTSLDIVSGSAPHVRNQASQMAQMSHIAPGARVRNNIDKWASTTVSLRGGRIEDSAAHPDAGRVWSFGSHRQRLTDAVNFRSEGETTVRLTVGSEARMLSSRDGEQEQLWVVSAALPTGGVVDPRRIEHSHVAFDYLVGARHVVAECPEATGREVPQTALPCAHPSSAGLGLVASEGTMPPWTELCFLIAILIGR